LAELLTKYPQMRDEKSFEMQKLLEQYRDATPQTRKPRVIRRVEPVYPADAREKNITGSVVLTVVVDREGNPQDIKISRSLYPSIDQAAIDAARQMRFEPALKDGQPVSETLLVEFYFSTQTKHVEGMAYGEGKGEGNGLGSGAGTGQGTGGGVGYVDDVREMRRRKEQEGQEDRTRRHADLAQGAVISMDRAIQVAISKYPGKVLACSLGRDKDGPVFYHVVIIGTEGDKTTTRYVWVSAVDGTILKTEDGSPRESLWRGRMIMGGVLNGKALILPLARYPDIARAARAQGSVTVQIVVDEEGNVASAKAVSGHPLLQSAAVDAARGAKFRPTLLSGEPTMVSGELVYNFVVQ
jgi:TonB family protein